MSTSEPEGQRGRPRRQEVYERLDIQIAELWQRLGGLPRPVEAAGIWRNIWFEEAHHSTAIEGNTLVLKQVATLLDEGRAVGNKELSEYMEVEGYAKAADWVYQQAHTRPPTTHDRDLLTKSEIREVHYMTMSGVWGVAPHPDATDRESPGNFREHDIEPFKGGMKPPSWPLIPSLLEDWVNEVNGLEPRSATLCDELASLHCRFEQIHPFIDGNGRTGRLLLNLILVRLGFPPVIIYKRDRETYLRGLQRADNGEPGQLGEMLARSILDNLYRFVVPAVAGPARLVPLAALATPEISVPALRAAAKRGRLQATRGSDGQWRSSRNWVTEYLAGRHSRE